MNILIDIISEIKYYQDKSSSLTKEYYIMAKMHLLYD